MPGSPENIYNSSDLDVPPAGNWNAQTGVGGIQNTAGNSTPAPPPGSFFANAPDLRGNWSSSDNYDIRDLVAGGGHLYYAKKASTSSSPVEPGVTSGWATYWTDLGADPGSGGGGGTVNVVRQNGLTMSHSTEQATATITVPADAGHGVILDVDVVFIPGDSSTDNANWVISCDAGDFGAPDTGNTYSMGPPENTAWNGFAYVGHSRTLLANGDVGGGAGVLDLSAPVQFTITFNAANLSSDALIDLVLTAYPATESTP